MGLNIAGVDILRSNEGPKVLEVNSSPGLQGIERTNNINVASLIIDYIEKKLGFQSLQTSKLVELRGLEPRTSSLPARRSPN